MRFKLLIFSSDLKLSIGHLFCVARFYQVTVSVNRRGKQRETKGKREKEREREGGEAEITLI